MTTPNAKQLSLIIASVFMISPVNAQQHFLHSYHSQQLTETYFSEGANAADVNGDQIPDVIYGPYWFAGPDFQSKHEIYKPVPQNTDGYANNFFNWPYDFNGDGWNDVLVVGFPGTPAVVYENPGSEGWNAHWKKHQVFDWVSNESPQLTNIVGDERPELVCTRDGFFGFATIDWDQPFEEWTFHPISDQVTAKRFGHGLGVGDVNGDGLSDLIHSKGWFEQPETHTTKSRWLSHKASFSQSYGGAEMYAYDVDGDGDNDVITSDAAHDFGLGWYEQISEGDAISFRYHVIMGHHPSQNRYGVLFTEPHSVALADMDGDGLKDIITGKTYWSHHKQSPMWDAGAVVYWFRLVRGEDGVDWVPQQIDAEAGIGRQVSIVDVNRDQLPDVVVGGMLGAHVLTQKRTVASRDEWLTAQPRLYSGEQLPSIENAEPLRGPKSVIDEDSGTVADVIEGENLKVKVTGGRTAVQDMSGFKSDRWSNDAQLWWTGGRIGDKLTIPLPKFTGPVDLEIVLTTAVDYGVIQLTLDDQKLGPPIDLYDTKVATTGVLSFQNLKTEGNQHVLTLQIAGANPKAKQAFMVAIDYLKVRPLAGNSKN